MRISLAIPKRKQCREMGANLAADPVICPNQPEEETLSACRDLGAALA